MDLQLFLADHGLWFSLMAVIGIFVLGVFKYFKAFDKIAKDKRKYVYALVSVIFSLIAVGVYLAITKCFTVEKFFGYIPILFALNQSLYAAYETMGIRALIRLIGTRIITLVAGKRIADIVQGLTNTTETSDTSNGVAGDTTTNETQEPTQTPTASLTA